MILHEIGTSVCHQSISRSFALGGQYLPLCSRCTGIYLGSFLTFIYMLFSKKRKSSGLPDKKIIYVLISFIILMGIDVGTAILELRQGNNYIRLFIGLFVGSSLISFLYPISNYILWEKQDDSSFLSNFIDLGLLSGFLLIFYVLIILNAGLLYWFLALFSILGIIALYLNVNTIFLIMIFKKEQTFKKITRIFIFFAGGIILSAVELYLLRLYHIWIK